MSLHTQHQALVDDQLVPRLQQPLGRIFLRLKPDPPWQVLVPSRNITGQFQSILVSMWMIIFCPVRIGTRGKPAKHGRPGEITFHRKYPGQEFERGDGELEIGGMESHVGRFVSQNVGRWELELC